MQRLCPRPVGWFDTRTDRTGLSDPGEEGINARHAPARGPNGEARLLPPTPALSCWTRARIASFVRKRRRRRSRQVVVNAAAAVIFDGFPLVREPSQ